MPDRTVPDRAGPIRTDPNRRKHGLAWPGRAARDADRLGFQGVALSEPLGQRGFNENESIKMAG
ncbi:hypothetical protein ACFYP0_07860 [Micromonospora arida]|uniref:hypothetical protein n=1 Tax=Micromonospora arida TaxID=2203715 RepID=UPI0036AC1D65